jgi:arginyl-tRNA synthetase
MPRTLSSTSTHDPVSQIENDLLGAAGGLGLDAEDALVRQSPPNQEGDYQSTLALRFGRERKEDPAQLAGELVAGMADSELYEPPTVSGKGFINFRLRTEFLAQAVSAIAADPRLTVTPVESPRKIVVDYSSPNVAKEMHVGHLRSTILGDALRRLLRFYGHEVISQNHLGDWGTPFGMLVEHMLDEHEVRPGREVTDLTLFYQEARHKFDSDEAFAERSRVRVVLLQQGDEESLAVWRRLREVSEKYFQEIYDALGVGLTPADNAGESFYNPMLADVVDELSAKELLTESDGALCIFLPGYTTRDGKTMPIIVRKRDGGFNYDTTDLAAIRYRLRDLEADAILYVVGSPQALHFSMLFDAAAAAGWAGEEVDLRHVAFGSVLGEDGKMLRTRAGKTIKLMDLLKEAALRARALLEERQLGSSDPQELAHSLGIGAIKYADLCSDRVRDYTFAFDRMLSFEGNTAAYLQYAHARVCSLLGRYGDPTDGGSTIPPVQLSTQEERALALQLLRFGTELSLATEQLEPHKLCVYLHDLGARFSSFYEACPIGTVDEATKESRLVVAAATGRTIATGLDLLGIDAPDRL